MKKVYIEITNSCNLDCSFCIHNDRRISFMDIDDFKIILNKIKPYTNYIYLHILGECLLHPKINEFIQVACDNSFYVNITTNGYLIDRLKNNNVRQINISLHSYDEKYNIDLDSYLNNIFNTVDRLDNTYISYRFWVNNKCMKDILDRINKHYNTTYRICDLDSSRKLKKNVFLDKSEEFIWPDLNNNYYSENGKCFALRDHIGILVDGTIVPCCLDSKGIINLGNIYKDNLVEVLNSTRVCRMVDCFRNGKRIEELCRKCNFKL